MNRWAIFLLSLIFSTSCAQWPTPKTLSEIRADGNCLRLERGMLWEKIQETLKGPDLAPLSEPDAGLRRNTRVYLDKMIIFYVENQEYQEGEKVRFHEVVTAIEICQRKN